MDNGLVYSGIDKPQYLQRSDPRTRGPQLFFKERAGIHPALRNSWMFKFECDTFGGIKPKEGRRKLGFNALSRIKPRRQMKRVVAG